ncbi:hypothetical protein [Methylocystis echinoides]|nr:hypothetical protein [Methylocystis echinoides]
MSKRILHSMLADLDGSGSYHDKPPPAKAFLPPPRWPRPIPLAVGRRQSLTVTVQQKTESVWIRQLFHVLGKICAASFNPSVVV